MPSSKASFSVCFELGMPTISFREPSFNRREISRKYLEDLGAEVALRKNQNGEIFKTDHGNIIADCNFGQIQDLNELNKALNSKAGIVEHGL